MKGEIPLLLTGSWEKKFFLKKKNHPYFSGRGASITYFCHNLLEKSICGLG